MERYGGVFDCQRFRDVMMYSMSVLSFSVPEAVRILADTLWRPALKQDEVAEICVKLISLDFIMTL